MIPIIALLRVAAVDFFSSFSSVLLLLLLLFGFFLLSLFLFVVYCFAFLCDFQSVLADVTMTRDAVARRRREGDTGLVPAGCSVSS